jgi:integral membrane protein
MHAALFRYRVIAYVVGTLLVVLFFVAMPMKYIGDEPILVEIVGGVHGFLYIGYLILTFDLTRRLGWNLRRTALVMLAGTVPVVSFVAERWVTRRVRDSHPVPARENVPVG